MQKGSLHGRVPGEEEAKEQGLGIVWGGLEDPCGESIYRLKLRSFWPLNQLLSQIEDPQLSFAVQRAPATVDAAVAAVLEMETYLQSRVPVAAVKEELVEGSAAANVVSRPSELSPLQKVME